MRFTDKVCFICGAYYQIEKHHIFGGANRNKSDKDGLIVFLCPECHRGKDGVHNNAVLMRMLKAFGQMQWMRETGKGVVEFIARYGKNYLADYKE